MSDEVPPCYEGGSAKLLALFNHPRVQRAKNASTWVVGSAAMLFCDWKCHWPTNHQVHTTREQQCLTRCHHVIKGGSAKLLALFNHPKAQKAKKKKKQKPGWWVRQPCCFVIRSVINPPKNNNVWRGTTTSRGKYWFWVRLGGGGVANYVPSSFLKTTNLTSRKKSSFLVRLGYGILVTPQFWKLTPRYE